MNYYLGLDNGGTTTKAALFTKDGKEKGVASVSTKMICPKPDFIERDMEEMWDANCSVIKEVIRKTGVRPEEIRGVGICGHGKGLYLWGKDGKPNGHGIISTDNRAYEYPEKWKADGTAEKVFALSCQHILACQPVSLLAWMKEHEPARYRNIRYVFECKDYVRFRLTGKAMAEMTDYSGANLMNLHTRQYDPELLSLFGIPEVLEALPPLVKSADLCGSITREAAEKTGLAEGTPVIGGMFDIDACALAVNVLSPEHICMIAGTWSINEYPGKKPVTDGSVLMNSLFCLPEYCLIEESSATSAGNNEWFIRQLLPEVKAEAKASGKSIYDVLNEWVSEIPPEEFVPVFFPFLMASNVHPNAKGSFIGITANHSRKHLLRSVYEGIVFSHRYHYERLLATRSDAPRGIRLAGGAAHSRVWTQMFADVMQCPVETVEADETGALGCAIAVAAAVGDYPGLEEAAEAMCTVSSRVMPNPSLAGIYDRKYHLYRSAQRLCLSSMAQSLRDVKS
jgi:L-xylulokinase